MNGSAERRNDINWNFIVEYNNNTVSSLEVHIVTPLQTLSQTSGSENEWNNNQYLFCTADVSIDIS